MRNHNGNDLPGQRVSGVFRLAVAASFVLTLCLALGYALIEKGPKAGARRAGIRLILACDNGSAPVSDAELDSIVQVLQARLARTGLQSAQVEIDAANRGSFVVTLPAGSDVNRIKSLLTLVGKLELRPVVHGTELRYRDKKSADADALDLARGIDCEVIEFDEVVAGEVNDSKQSDRHGWIILEKRVLIGNGDILKATAEHRNGDHLVDFTLTQAAADRFGQWTGTHIGDSLAILLDQVFKSAPVIRSKIGDRGVIEGAFNETSAEDLAYALESGALRVPLRVLSEERLQDKKRQEMNWLHERARGRA